MSLRKIRVQYVES